MQLKDYVLEQLCNPLEMRIRLMLYASVGLLIYFIFDFSGSHYSNDYLLVKGKIEDTQNEIEASSALIKELPNINNSIEKLKNELALLRKEKQEWIDRIVLCNENILVNTFHNPNNSQNPFNEFHVQKGATIQSMVHYIYTVELNGQFEDILQLFDRLDDSLCRWNVSAWTLDANPENNDLLAGSVVMDIYKLIEEEL
jgi:hypothetical protein